MAQDLGTLEAYELLDHRVGVAVPSGDPHAAARGILGGFGPIDDANVGGLPRYEVTGGENGWQVSAEGARVLSGADLLVSLGVMEWHIVTAALARRRDLFHLHGAALAEPYGLAGVVLSGESGAGKTTITLALMRRGFLPFADDITLIDPVSLALRPFRRAFHVEPQTRGLVELVSGDPTFTENGPAPGYFVPARWADRPAPVRWVLLLELCPGEPPELFPVTPAEAAATVLARTVSLDRTPRLALAAAARLTERAACYRCRIGDLVTSVAMIERLVRSTSAERVP